MNFIKGPLCAGTTNFPAMFNLNSLAAHLICSIAYKYLILWLQNVLIDLANQPYAYGAPICSGMRNLLCFWSSKEIKAIL